MTNQIKTWQERLSDQGVKSGYEPVPSARLGEMGWQAMKDEIAELRAKVVSLAADAEMFAWIHSKHRTDSNAMVKLELRMLNDDYPTIEEVRIAVADAMAKEKA